jgi:hypothetical protein
MTYTTPSIVSTFDLAARLGFDTEFSAKRGGDDDVQT